MNVTPAVPMCSAVFYIVCSLVMFVVNGISVHIVEAYSIIGLIIALYIARDVSLCYMVDFKHGCYFGCFGCCSVNMVYVN